VAEGMIEGGAVLDVGERTRQALRIQVSITSDINIIIITIVVITAIINIINISINIIITATTETSSTLFIINIITNFPSLISLHHSHRTTVVLFQPSSSHLWVQLPHRM
jgi:hypothetical protein